MNRILSSLTFASLVLGQSVCSSAQAPPDILSLGAAGVATSQPDVLTIAAPLANLSGTPISALTIDRAELSPANVRSPLPIRVGAIRPRTSAIVQADFNSKALVPGNQYDLVLQGTFQLEKRAAAPFRVHVLVTMPPRTDGSHSLGKIQVPSHKVEGGRYPRQPPHMGKDVNQAAPPVPTIRHVPGAPTPNSTELKPAPIGDPPAIAFNANDPV